MNDALSRSLRLMLVIPWLGGLTPGVLAGEAGDAEMVEALMRVNRRVADRALPTVVQVFSGNRFMAGNGSGVIIDGQDGIILTNNHVVEDSNYIVIQLLDGRRFEAEIVGADPPTDLAVIRISENEIPELPELPFGDSDALSVGDAVMTIGNPFGLQGTVSSGIVSAINRFTPDSIIDYEGFIQTDAVINPGNSGGPLVNMRGELVGINTAIESNTGGFNGVGFAIPASKVQRVLPALLRGEKVARGFLGVVIVNAGYNPLTERLDWKEPHGVLIDGVAANSPAQEAGLRADDIIVRLDGLLIRQTEELTEAVAARAPGTEVILDLWRKGNMVSLRAELGQQAPDFAVRQNRRRSAPDQVNLEDIGLTVETLDEESADRFELGQRLPSGAVVTRVISGSRADRVGVDAGDIITHINGVGIEDTDDLRVMLLQLYGLEADELRLRLFTDRGTRDVTLSLLEE